MHQSHGKSSLLILSLVSQLILVIHRKSGKRDKVNRAYPENANFETGVPRNLKFHRLSEDN